jgi:hypothetical protein
LGYTILPRIELAFHQEEHRKSLEIVAIFLVNAGAFFRRPPLH